MSVESLGSASLRLEVDTREFRANMQSAHGQADEMQHSLDALAAIAKFSEESLKRVKFSTGQAAESKASAEGILSGVRGISDEAREAARVIDNVKISEAQATESVVAGERIKRNVNDIGDEADRTKRKLEEVRLAGGRNGAGIGPFGSGFGRIGVVGAGVGAGVLAGPAAIPAALGLLAATPVLAGAAGGALGTLALAFDGVGKAIGGDKKAFDGLGPSAQALVQTVRSLDGWFDRLRETAAGNLFPGLERGLKAALSPSTLNAITGAVTALGRALGSAGEAWGKYFGSPEFARIFGPLMQSAAGTLSDFSDAALHLFDALGVLARAAIPLTSWMTAGIDSAAKLADGWLRAKDATGQLGRAMGEAQSSLRLVGGLVGSLFNAVGALGQALYPVAKVAVKDLTDGLNALAGIIDRNKQTIRDIVGGALAAFVATVKAAKNVVADLWPLLDKVVHLLGGWKTAFEALIGFKIASVVAGWALAFEKLAGAEALGGASTAAGTLLTKLGALSRLGPIIIPVGLDYFINKYGGKNAIQAGLNPFKSLGPDVAADVIDPLTGQPSGSPADIEAKKRLKGQGKAGYDPGIAAAIGTNLGKNKGFLNEAAIRQLLLSAGAPMDLATNLARISAHGEDPSGSIGALNNNPATGDYSIGLFQENFLGRMGVDRTAKYAPMFGLKANMPVPAFVAWLGQHPTAQAKIALDIFNSQGYGAWTTAKGLGITDATAASSPFGTAPPFTSNLGPKPVIPSGANLLPEALRNALQKARDKVTTSQGAVAARWLNAELADLEQARKLLASDLAGASGKRKANIQAELRTIDGQIATVNKQITTNLHQQAQAIKTAYAAKLSADKQKISAAMDLIKSALDAQLQAQTQAYIDNVLGPQFSEGTDAQGRQRMTPLEKQLADMQAADTLKSLQDAVTQAQTPEEKAAAQRQLDEYNLSIQASAERAQADHDYQVALKGWQDSQAEKQRELDKQLDAINAGLQNGSSNLDALSQVVTDFGLSLNAPGGVSDAFGQLVGAIAGYVTDLGGEAIGLQGVGDTKDAGKIQQKIGSLTSGLPSSGRGGLRMVPMAAGGVGHIPAGMPRAFLSMGDEDYAFSGEGRSFSNLGGLGGTGGGITLNMHGNLIHERDLETVIVRALQTYVGRGGRPIRGLST